MAKFPSVVCLILGGELYRIDLGPERLVFEMHPQMGPMPVRQDNFKPRSLAPRHRFWWAVSCWAKQGRRVVMEKSGEPKLCMWDPVSESRAL